MTTHLTHWGAFEADSDGKSLSKVRAWQGDPEPNGLIDNISASQHHPARVDQPYVRRGWLEHGPGAAGRGSDDYVAVPWDQVIALLAAELRRVYTEHGAEAVFGGSYGWGSAGRFHHAQSQVHRFLNTLGGYVRSVNSYSYGTAEVLLPHILGSLGKLLTKATSWEVLAEHCELVVAFGGISPKNSQVAAGGVTRHGNRQRLSAMRERGCRFVSVSPLADDTPPEAEADWIAPRPGSDAALMLAIAYVLDTENLADEEFCRTHTTGYDEFIAYVRGESDGITKDPQWAQSLCQIPAQHIVDLARDMAAKRTMVLVSWSLQRTQFGEQPLWLGIALAAMLGQFGLPGGGFGFGYGSTSDVGTPAPVASTPALPQGRNAVSRFIPVARIADMLLNPGERFQYNGLSLSYPDIRLVYWCGGNPFHHHQDLSRLREAFSRPETVVVHDPFWTSTARHADVVLPSTMSIERDDFGSGQNDPVFQPMPALTEPHAQARDDYVIFAELAARLGVGEHFTEGRNAQQWLRHLYDRWRQRLTKDGHQVPPFDEFWGSARFELPVSEPRQVYLSDFRADPEKHPLPTPSGKIELYSQRIADFGYSDCPGHPVWREPEEWLGGPLRTRYPFHLIANQPKTKLHSQLDIGPHSQAAKVGGREPLRMHPTDAAELGLSDGDIVRVSSPRGSCLAGLVLSSQLRREVVQLSTGAWYDPDPGDPALCRHGNVNVLTADRPSSTLSQGSTGQHCLVAVERYDGPQLDLSVGTPPIAADEAG